MAVGSVVAQVSQIAANSTLAIQPPAGAEWVIHNIYLPVGSNVDLQRTDGTNTCDFDNLAGSRYGFNAFHVTNAEWLVLKNNASTAVMAAFDGIQTT